MNVNSLLPVFQIVTKITKIFKFEKKSSSVNKETRKSDLLLNQRIELEKEIPTEINYSRPETPMINPLESNETTENNNIDHSINTSTKFWELNNNINEHDYEPAQLVTIHVAAENGSIEMMKTLLSLGENIHLRDEQNRTAMDIACNLGHHELVAFLIENGASSDTTKKLQVKDIILFPVSFAEKTFNKIKLIFNKNMDENEPYSANDKLNETKTDTDTTSESKHQSISQISEANSLEKSENYSEEKPLKNDYTLDMASTEDNQKKTVDNSIGQGVENNTANDELEKGRPERKRTVQFSETLSVIDQGEIYSARLEDATRKENYIKKRRRMSSQKHKLRI